MHIYEWTQIPDIICVSDKSVHFYPERLQKITDILLHNMDILPDQGLANGKMGAVLYLYRLNKFVNDQYLGDVADKLLDTVTENIQKENILGSFTTRTERDRDGRSTPDSGWVAFNVQGQKYSGMIWYCRLVFSQLKVTFQI